MGKITHSCFYKNLGNISDAVLSVFVYISTKLNLTDKGGIEMNIFSLVRRKGDNFSLVIAKIAVGILVSFMFIVYLPAPVQSQDRLQVIDMHMHADQPPGDVPAGAPPPCRPEPCQGKGHATANPTETLQKTLEAMKRYNIVKGFVSGLNLDIVEQWVAAAPDRFIASPFIFDPRKLNPEKLRQKYAGGQLAGMGEIATQLNGFPPNDPALEPFFALAEELDLPTLIHTLGIGPYLPGFRSAAGSPLLLEDVLVRHPKLRLFVENAGYPYRDEMIAVMSQYPQLYADVSTITWVIPRTAFYDYLEAFIRAGLGKRLMFGSDQMRWPEKIGEGIEAIEKASFLTKEQKRDILYNNAVHFLRMEEELAGKQGS
jgi:predicted TIM-barrel fold metal-dependent hydrolase